MLRYADGWSLLLLNSDVTATRKGSMGYHKRRGGQRVSRSIVLRFILTPSNRRVLPQWFYVLSLGSQKKLHDSFIFLNDNTKVSPEVHKRKLPGEIYPLLSTS